MWCRSHWSATVATFLALPSGSSSNTFCGLRQKRVQADSPRNPGQAGTEGRIEEEVIGCEVFGLPPYIWRHREKQTEGSLKHMPVMLVLGRTLR